MYLPDEKSIVGRNLQILINQKNWSIKQAAKELNYDRMNLSKMLSGSQNFRIKTLVKFAHFFDVPVFLLFNRLFEDEQYRKNFSFVDEDYMHVFRVNFKATSVKQSLIHILFSSIYFSQFSFCQIFNNAIISRFIMAGVYLLGKYL